jgi:hypothetical protein
MPNSLSYDNEFGIDARVPLPSPAEAVCERRYQPSLQEVEIRRAYSSRGGSLPALRSEGGS